MQDVRKEVGSATATYQTSRTDSEQKRIEIITTSKLLYLSSPTLDISQSNQDVRREGCTPRQEDNASGRPSEGRDHPTQNSPLLFQRKKLIKDNTSNNVQAKKSLALHILVQKRLHVDRTKAEVTSHV